MRAGRVYIARQIGFSVLVLWVIVSLSFFLRGLSGLQPLTQGDFGSGPPSQSGLSASAYLGYLGDVLHLDFGHSLAYPFGSVATLVATALPWTVLLVGIGIYPGTLLASLEDGVNRVTTSVQSARGVPASQVALMNDGAGSAASAQR